MSGIPNWPTYSWSSLRRWRFSDVTGVPVFQLDTKGLTVKRLSKRSAGVRCASLPLAIVTCCECTRPASTVLTSRCVFACIRVSPLGC